MLQAARAGSVPGTACAALVFHLQMTFHDSCTIAVIQVKGLKVARRGTHTVKGREQSVVVVIINHLMGILLGLGISLFRVFMNDPNVLFYLLLELCFFFHRLYHTLACCSAALRCANRSAFTAMGTLYLL